LEEEVTLLYELGQTLRGTMFAKWMKSRRTLCLDHARKVKTPVPLRLRALIDEIVEQNRMELRAELQGFEDQLKQGVHARGGLPGLVPEFLVGQRGL
jgi:hypothetical protein